MRSVAAPIALAFDACHYVKNEVPSLRAAVAFLASLACLNPVTVWSADPTKAFFRCLKSADEQLAIPLMEKGQPQPTHTSMAIVCDGAPARDLFEALELISAQEVRSDSRGGMVTRRSGNGIACFRSQGVPISFYCSIGINVGGPFVDAVK